MIKIINNFLNETKRKSVINSDVNVTVKDKNNDFINVRRCI